MQMVEAAPTVNLHAPFRKRALSGNTLETQTGFVPPTDAPIGSEGRIT
jgi:hypothetical protein